MRAPIAMSLNSPVKVCQVEVPGRKLICIDRPRQNMSMSTPCQTETTHVQTFVRSKSLCPDFYVFNIAYVQTLVRSKPNFVCSKIEICALMCILSCVQKYLCTNFLAFKSCLCPDLVRSPQEQKKLCGAWKTIEYWDQMFHKFTNTFSIT